MSVASVRSPVARLQATPESFEDFTSLDLNEVLHRAEAVEARPEENAAAPLPCAEGAWRRVYREMIRARVTKVAHLKRHEVERHASKLGYGYFRIRVNNRDAFMPLRGSRDARARG